MLLKRKEPGNFKYDKRPLRRILIGMEVPLGLFVFL
ncbi:MAG: hypothetical protein G01um1014107_249 [Parcubacteria group bacterium Gr01-1014_107]|nr:MAG: hypothetical protein G01um1014107_249 [Parcubacteria group bacterium Gr01-1014_107]